MTKKRDLISINVNELKDFLGHIISNNRFLQEQGKSPVSVEVIGESGIGKTSAIIQLAKEQNLNFVKLNLAQIEEIGDLVGFPIRQFEVEINNEKSWVDEHAFEEYLKLGYKSTGQNRMSYCPPEWIANKDKGRSFLPNEMQEYIDSLFEVVEPVIDWKSYLRRFNSMSTMIYTKKTRRKPNKRFGDGPALKIKQKKRTLVAIDTSGSVSKEDLIEFFNEIHHIYKSGTYIDIVECDAKIHRVYEYKGERENLEVKGRGGTDFEPVMKYLMKNKNKYANLIYLTDGCCSSPQTQPIKPMLWVHSSGNNINESLPGAKVRIVR